MMPSTENATWLVSQYAANFIMAIIGYVWCKNLIPTFKGIFIEKGLKGNDLGSKDKRTVAESMGVICGCVFIIIMFLFIPIPSMTDMLLSRPGNSDYQEMATFLSALLSICCMLFLGFADDVLDLRWKHKLLLPTLASLPLLMVYFVTCNHTIVILPKPVRPYLGNDLWLGPLYYLYMGMLAVFCTNAINIYAGINGLEVGQTVVIASSVILYNLIEIQRFPDDFEHLKIQLFSLSILQPFLGVSLALLQYNWYPASVFVGDTFCYFAGMTFAVVAILGHFSKTMLLFFIPQIFNFLFSCPQLFHLVPCPRHRLPRFDAKTNLRYPSTCEFRYNELSWIAKLILMVFSKLRLVRINQIEPSNKEFNSVIKNGSEIKLTRSKTKSIASKDSTNPTTDQAYMECTNFTLVNLWLVLFGPMTEKRLTTHLLYLQAFSSLIAFSIRYGLSRLFY